MSSPMFATGADDVPFTTTVPTRAVAATVARG